LSHRCRGRANEDSMKEAQGGKKVGKADIVSRSCY
jgi:hypothetical protein